MTPGAGRLPRRREPRECMAKGEYRRPRKLAEGEAGKARDNVSVPAPKTAWLRQQAEQPFQPVALHPDRRLSLCPREEIEGSPHPDHHGRFNPVTMARHPALLLRRAETDPHDVRACRIDG